MRQGNINLIGLSLGSNIWLAKWADDPNSSVGNVRDGYLIVYAALGTVYALFLMLTTVTLEWVGLTAATQIHNEMLENLLLAPMFFFDTNPKGKSCFFIT